MLKIAWRYTIRNKKRTLVSVLGIAFSVMLMFSLIQMGDCIMVQFTNMAAAGMKRDFTIADVSYEQLKKAEQILVDAGLEENYMLTMNAASWYEDDYNAANIIGVKGNFEYFKDTKIVEGDYPKKPYEVCIEEVFNEVREEPYQIGDTIKAVLESETTNKKFEAEFVVSGVIKNISDDGKRIWTNLQTANEIQKELGVTDNIDNAIAVVAVKGASDFEKSFKIQTILEEQLELDNFYKEHYILNEGKDILFTEESGYQSVSNTLKGITILLGICMVVFVFNTYHISAIEKINQLAAMRCIGLNKKQQNKILLYEGLIIGSLGILLGFAGGNLLNYAFAEKVTGYLMGTEGVKISQTPISYIETYLLAMASVLIAMGKVIVDIRKCTILEALHYSEENKGRFGKRIIDIKKKQEDRNTKKLKSPLWQIAKRNLQRNPSKSNTLLVTMTISIILSLVVFSAFFSIDLKNGKWSKAEIFQYEMYSKDVLKDELSTEFCENVFSMAGNENVYQQYFCREIECEAVQGTGVTVIIYDDSLFGLLLETMGMKDLDYEKEPYALFYSKKPLDITNIKAFNGFTKKDIEIDIAKKFHEGENYVIYSSFGYDGSFLILNKAMGKQLGADVKGCTGLLIKNRQNFIAADFQNCSTESDKIYIENLNKNRERDKKQFLGIVFIAGYIMLATISLTCIIVSSTLQANIISRKKEFAVMGAIGLTKKKNILICCMENFILFIKAYIIGAFIATGLNIVIGEMLEDGIKWNLFIYMGVALFFATVMEGMSIKHMRTQLKVSTAELLKEQ